MVLAGVLAVSAMAGCGNSGSSSTTAAAGEKTAETTVADSQGSTAAASEASKTDYPTQNVNGIVQWGEGGGTDSLMRPLATLAQDKLGQSIVVQNMTGGTGSIATQYVYDQNADGYNLLMGAENPSLYDALDILDEFFYRNFFTSCFYFLLPELFYTRFLFHILGISNIWLKSYAFPLYMHQRSEQTTHCNDGICNNRWCAHLPSQP